MTDYSCLSMPIGEAMFIQRSVRTFKPDPIPKENLSLIVEAAVKAPNSGNRQVGCLFLVTDRAKIREFAPLYHEAWWVKRLPATRADFTLTAAEHMVIPAVPLTGSLRNPASRVGGAERAPTLTPTSRQPGTPAACRCRACRAG
jgi:nitroreductase